MSCGHSKKSLKWFIPLYDIDFGCNFVAPERLTSYLESSFIMLQEVDTIIKELRALEPKIIRLFDLKIPTTALEVNFTKAVQWITFLLADNNNSMINQKYWQDKLAGWSMLYDSIVNTTGFGGGRNDGQWSKDPKAKPKLKRKKKKKLQSNTEVEQSSCFMSPPKSCASDCSLLSTNSEEYDEKSLQSYRFWTPWNLSILFGGVYDISSDMDLPGMNALLVKFSEAFKILDPDFDDAKLQLFGFKVAFCKLPKQMRLHFDAEYEDENRSMYSVYNYVRIQYEARINAYSNLVSNSKFVDLPKQQQLASSTS